MRRDLAARKFAAGIENLSTVLLVDTNVWFETIDDRNRDFARCVQASTGHVGHLVTLVTVITETAWLIEDRFGPETKAKFLQTALGVRTDCGTFTGCRSGAWC